MDSTVRQSKVLSGIVIGRLMDARINLHEHLNILRELRLLRLLLANEDACFINLLGS